MQSKDGNKRKIHCTKVSKVEICADKLLNIGYPLKHSVFLLQPWVAPPQLDILQTPVDLDFATAVPHALDRNRWPGLSYPWEHTLQRWDLTAPLLSVF